MIIVSTFLVIVTGFFAFKAFKDKRGKFRDYRHISILIGTLISITNLQNNQSNDNFVVPHFIEIVSKRVKVLIKKNILCQHISSD